ncbi:hypothetical protein Btru_010716 [Bulinus truncatus]|nr:hypothetical protein Btru_010716 [Bulinus truncatus]
MPSFKIPDSFKETEAANLSLNSDDEFFLLRVPKGYDVKKLNGKEFSPNQISEIEIKEDKNQLTCVYELSSFPQQQHNILPIIKDREKGVTLGPPISGIININKSYRFTPSASQLTLDSNKDKHVSMPEGLRPRFVPFGSGRPHKLRKHKKKKRRRPSVASEFLSDLNSSPEKKKRKSQNVLDYSDGCSLSGSNDDIVLLDSSDNLNSSQDVTNGFIHKKKKRKK